MLSRYALESNPLKNSPIDRVTVSPDSQSITSITLTSLLASVPRLVELGAQIVLLGSGDPGLEEGLRSELAALLSQMKAGLLGEEAWREKVERGMPPSVRRLFRDSYGV